MKNKNVYQKINPIHDGPHPLHHVIGFKVLGAFLFIYFPILEYQDKKDRNGWRWIKIFLSKKDKIGAWEPYVRLYPSTKNLIILPMPPHGNLLKKKKKKGDKSKKQV
jgi:hypothetical protein